jgi:hypothetical protein
MTTETLEIVDFAPIDGRVLVHAWRTDDRTSCGILAAPGRLEQKELVPEFARCRREACHKWFLVETK